MAVFPKRITLKNSSDTEAAIRTAIGSGGSDEILPGEVVIGTETGNVRFYTRDDAGSIISLGESGASAFSQCLVSGTEPTTLPDGSSLVEGSMWFNSTTEAFSVYYSGAWVEVSGGGGGSGIENVVEDTSPQLGGDLDVNGYDITSVASVEFSPANGEAVVRGGTEAGKLTLNCTANSHGVSIQSPPHASAATYTLVLPDDTGVSGQVLSTDGSGLLSWADNSGGGGATTIDDLTDVDTTTTPPTDGQALVWDNANSQWEPGTVSGGGGAVDSVNGQTGVVSLGIQDMDDYALEAAGDTLTWSTKVDDGSGGYAFAKNPNEYSLHETLNRLYINQTVDGSDVTAQILLMDGEAGDITVDGVTVSGSFSSVLDRGAGNGYSVNIGADISSLRSLSGAMTVVLSAWSSGSVPLADGDVLRWVNADQKFKPAPSSVSRTTRSVATSAIEAGAGESVTVSGTGKTGQLLAIETDQAAWVTIYASQAARTADAARLETVSPDAGSGVIAEVITTGAQRILVTPCINFFNDEATPASELYLKVVNKSGATQAITTTLTVVLTEA